METTQTINFEKEAKELEQTEFFRPEPGTHQLIINHAGLQQYTDHDTGEVKTNMVLNVKSEAGKNYKWRVNKASTLGSLYGQLIEIGKDSGGLDGKTVILKVSTTGKTYKGFPVKSYAVLLAPKVPSPQ